MLWKAGGSDALRARPCGFSQGGGTPLLAGGADSDMEFIRCVSACTALGALRDAETAGIASDAIAATRAKGDRVTFPETCGPMMPLSCCFLPSSAKGAEGASRLPNHVLDLCRSGAFNVRGSVREAYIQCAAAAVNGIRCATSSPTTKRGG